MRILVVDNDEARSKMLDRVLTDARFNPYFTDTAKEAFDLASRYDYDIILMNLGVSGVRDNISRLRISRINTPIACLVDTVNHKQTAELLSDGADDVIGLPFHLDELLARLTCIIRRSRGHATSAITIGQVVVNLDSKSVTVSGSPVHLTGKEYGIMELLALRKGNMLTKEHFLNHLYGGLDEPEETIINVFVCKLRKKLAEAGADGLISTVFRGGYRLQEPTSANSEALVTRETEDLYP